VTAVEMDSDCSYGSGQNSYTTVQTIGLDVTPQMAFIVQTQVCTDSNGDVVEDGSGSYNYSGQWSITGTRTCLLSFSVDGDGFELACTADLEDELVVPPLLMAPKSPTRTSEDRSSRAE
jgi:hypothetical protein